MYVVRPGDTLANIAERLYGSSAEWPRIYDANRDRIGNPTRIYRGQMLRVPAPANSAANPTGEAREAASRPQPNPESDSDRPAAEPGTAPAQAPRTEDDAGAEADAPAAEVGSVVDAGMPEAGRVEVAEDGRPEAESVPVVVDNQPSAEASAGSENSEQAAARRRSSEGSTGGQAVGPAASAGPREAEHVHDTTMDISGLEGRRAHGPGPDPDVADTSPPAEVHLGPGTTGASDRDSTVVGEPKGISPATRTESGAAGATRSTGTNTTVPSTPGGSGWSPAPGRTGAFRFGIDQAGGYQAGLRAGIGNGAGGTTTGVDIRDGRPHAAGGTGRVGVTIDEVGRQGNGLARFAGPTATTHRN
ncbi:MAG: LysM peptidoglycan-binding domain-containing protein [Chloroflexota bacterium]|nr:LysM peptidoglycan-binding domain-containing protein [Chloroflexota bacterium]